MKRAYETVVIVNGMLGDDKIDGLLKGVEGFLAKNTELKQVEPRGKRRMAYPIQKKTHGHYTIFAYDGEGTVVAELERKLKLDENVIRYMTVLRCEAQPPMQPPME